MQRQQTQEPRMNHALVLDRSRFARLHGPRHLQVTHGTLWLTIDHDPDDHVLTRGQAFDLPAGACVDAPAPWWQPFVAALRGAAGAHP
jgi:hypothetical protein